jgi:hypothetical protein
VIVRYFLGRVVTRTHTRARPGPPHPSSCFKAPGNVAYKRVTGRFLARAHLFLLPKLAVAPPLERRCWASPFACNHGRPTARNPTLGHIQAHTAAHCSALPRLSPESGSRHHRAPPRPLPAISQNRPSRGIKPWVVRDPFLDLPRPRAPASSPDSSQPRHRPSEGSNCEASNPSEGQYANWGDFCESLKTSGGLLVRWNLNYCMCLADSCKIRRKS